jgi:hypothetical protein
MWRTLVETELAARDTSNVVTWALVFGFSQ